MPYNDFCPLCDKKISQNDSKFMLAIDHPNYLNIYVHKYCFSTQTELEINEKLREIIKNHSFPLKNSSSSAIIVDRSKILYCKNCGSTYSLGTRGRKPKNPDLCPKCRIKRE